MSLLYLAPLTHELLPAALELDQRCFGGLWTAAGYQRELDSPNSELLVLMANETMKIGEEPCLAQFTIQNLKCSSQEANSLAPYSSLLGLGCYWAILEEAHITILAIDPAYQRQGLGQALLYGLMRSAYQRGLERATLEVKVSNHTALALYQKFGFREAGRRKRYYQDTGEDALVLWLNGLQTPGFLSVLQEWQGWTSDRLQQSGWKLPPHT